MTIRMLINAMAAHELRIAIVEDGELTELDIEASETSTLKGNVYKGVIHNVEGSLEAAFVDIGRHKQGFLPFSEVSSSQYGRPWSGKGRPKITDVLKRGQEIIVQVAKDAIGEKGATLTTYLSLPGRYTVLMPDSDANGISRKIEDEKVRKRIRAIAQKIKKPEGCGFIVRTAGFGQTRLALQKDLDKIVEQWRKLQGSAKMARAPSIIHSEPDLIGRTLRDFFSDEIDEVVIDAKEEYDAAVEYFKEVMPVYEDRVRHYDNPIPIFAYHHVEEQIEATFERRVKLPSGGSIVIDETEALVAIDVNSGRMTSEGDHERTVFKTNCEAAEEAARQLKLRDLGGIVVVDFIDMEESKHKREVENVLAEAAKEDKARYKISRINSKGLCVLTRQRIRQGMRKAYQYRCPVCSGTGWLRTGESHSLSLLRRVEARLAQGGVGEVRVLTHRETADYILNQKRSQLLDLERQYACRIVVIARLEMDRGKDEVTYLSNKEVLEEITDKLPAREERRTRGGKRKRKSRKRPVEGAEPAEVEPASSDSESDARSKRRRKRRRGRAEGEGVEPSVVEAEGEAEADSEGAGEVVALAPKGATTFTGRLSPAELERARAERRARQARKFKDPAAAAAALAEVKMLPPPPDIEEAFLEPSEAPAVSALLEQPEDVQEAEPSLSTWEPVAAEGQSEPVAASAAPWPPQGSMEGMDVVHALAVAKAVVEAGASDVDEEALIQAAGMAAESLEAPEQTGDEPEQAEASEDELSAGDSDEDSASKARSRRRRRRRGRRKKDTGSAETVEEAAEPAEDAPDEELDASLPSAGPLTDSPPIAVDPEVVAARRALLHKIFSAR